MFSCTSQFAILEIEAIICGKVGIGVCHKLNNNHQRGHYDAFRQRDQTPITLKFEDEAEMESLNVVYL